MKDLGPFSSFYLSKQLPGGRYNHIHICNFSCSFTWGSQKVAIFATFCKILQLKKIHIYWAETLNGSKSVNFHPISLPFETDTSIETVQAILGTVTKFQDISCWKKG